MSDFVMLAYYAQRKEDLEREENASKLLKHLTDERREMKEACEKSPLRFYSREPDEATISRIFSDLELYERELTVFHYSGHADVDKIFLGDQNANAEALARLLGRCTNLRLVFLNGCCTSGHVYELFKNNVPFVIATNYPVKDSVAYRFAAEFYRRLFANANRAPDALLNAYRHAYNFVTLGSDTSGIVQSYLKDSNVALEPQTTISDHVRGGLKIEGKDAAWGFHMLNQNDPRAAGTWLPVMKKKTDLARAFTCGRDGLSDIFRRHWAKQSCEKKVLHYFQIDENRKSMEGVSIKLLFENITRDLNISDGVPYHYPTNPNHDNFRERSIRIFPENACKEEIIAKIHENILSDSITGHAIVPKTFADLYKLQAVQRKKLVFLFINIKREAFENLRDPIYSVIQESIAANSDSGSSMSPRVLFFWHIETEKDGLFSLFGSFRKKTARWLETSFGSNVCVVHETDCKPIPVPNSEELETWINLNNQPIDHLDELEGLMRKYQNVMTLENKLKTLLLNTNP